MTKIIEITQPDDWHIHLRHGDIMRSVTPLSARQFGRVMVMPNLTPPITTVDMAHEYREHIKQCSRDYPLFNPLMSLYLTEMTPLQEVERAAQSEHVVGFKLYPAGATTNSSSGVKDVLKVYPILEQMQKHGVVLQIHGEVTDPEIDVFDREAVFIDNVLAPITNTFPHLKIVFEHITTQQAAQFVIDSKDNIGATISPQHLMFSRNALFQGGIRPHYYCLPILKRSTHQDALLSAIQSGNRKFFLGTDSAPHTQDKKETDCGCAGIFSAHAAIEFYASVFDQLGIIEKLEAFSSFNGADFYGLQRNTKRIRLIKQKQQIIDTIEINQENISSSPKRIIPLLAGDNIDWQMLYD